MFEFTVNVMVRGYHVYQDLWEVNIDKILPCTREVGNCHDPYTITVQKDETVVGHLPHKISYKLYALFLSGEEVKYIYIVTNSSRYSEDLAQGGMEIHTLYLDIQN